MDFLPYFICFILAAFVAYMALSSQYPNTSFLLRRYLPYYCYPFFWGILSVVTYLCMDLMNIHISIVQTDIDRFNNFYLKATIVGLFTKSVFDGFNFKYSIGSEDRIIGLKNISEIIEPKILNAVKDKHDNSLREFVEPRSKGYKTLEDVKKRISADLPKHLEDKKYFAKTYMLDLDDEVIKPEDPDWANNCKVMENFLITFGKRTFDRVFPEQPSEDPTDSTPQPHKVE
ncbi:MAG: hypothetical protein NTU95_04510 [Methanothrix sp.]|nr:hypothetical protein [Methanothrix sp.]